MTGQLMLVDLVRNFRHQLRTPVNHIVGFSEMLEEEAADRCWDALLPDLQRIRDVGRSLSDFIGATVDVAKVEGGKLDPAEISRDLRTPLESVLGYSQLLQEIAEERGWPEALPDLQKVESAAKYLTGLIAGVLDLATAYSAGGAASGRAPQRESAPERPPAGGAAAGSGSVLLCEDDPFDGEMLVRRLLQLGYTVTLVGNGREALDMLNERAFDIALLDVLLPEIDGFEALRIIRSTEALRDVPAIMISAIEEVPIVVRCIEMGADDYLAKPVDPVLLRAKVEAALERCRLRAYERAYLAHVTKVTAAAAAMEASTYSPGSLADVARRDDSLGRLARVFERMAQELQAREQSLQQQVEELRIEIDHVKLARDLAAITGAEYFQEVRRRSRRLREAKEQWAAEPATGEARDGAE